MASRALDSIQDNTHLPEVQRFTQKYILKRTLHRGKFNAQACGYDKNTRKKVIIKAVYNTEPCPFKEAFILKKLRAVPGVVTYLDHYAIKCDTHLLVMEYFGQMNLAFFLSTNGAVSETIAHLLFRQLFNTVHSCFQKGILHKKLTVNNILIDVRTNQIKIVNFNSATQFDADVFTSPLHHKVAPPEYIESNIYTADGLYVWVLGLILYELIFNTKPFKTPHDVTDTPLTIPPHKQVLSLDIIALLNWMLAKFDRITLHQIGRHPWISKQWP
jgi:serine/threonine protein kinase